MQTPLFIFAILGAGLVFGTIARFILPGRQPLSLAETTIIGMIGAAVGAMGVNLIVGSDEFDRIDLGTIVGGIAGSVLVLGIFTWIADHFGFRVQPKLTTSQLIEAGESSTVEFKSSARWNVHTQAKDDRIELVIAKTIAGFLNAEGGTLVIGVDDDGKALGLDNDLALMKAPDNDRYELWLIDHLQKTIGKPALAFVSVHFDKYAGEDVVLVDAAPSDFPVYLDEKKGGRTADFYVRMGNSTRRLLTDEFADYQRSRWK
ncbi:MAG: RNA-binding domain-containing protein [Acidimicrobiia bacterium]